MKLFSRALKSLESWTSSRLGLAAFLGALTTRVAYILYFQTWTRPPVGELTLVALSVAEGRGFASPYLDDGSPSAVIAPGYPLLLGIIYFFLGYDTFLSNGVQQVLATLVAASVYGLLPWAAERLGIGRMSGFWGAAAGIALPLYPWAETSGLWDTSYSALLYLVTTIALVEVVRDLAGGLGTVVGLGLLVGGTMLVSPTPGPSLVCVALLLTVTNRGRRVESLKRILILGVVSVCVLAPWVWRNYQIWNAFVPVRSFYGVEVRLGNNDRAHSVWALGESSPYPKFHPMRSKEQKALLAELGEPGFAKRMQADAMRWAKDNPETFRRLTVWRAIGFWLFHNRFYKRAMKIGLTLVAAAGLVLILRRRPTASLVLGSGLAIFPIPYYLVANNERYFYPMYWLLLLCAGYSVMAGAEALQRRARSRLEHS